MERFFVVEYLDGDHAEYSAEDGMDGEYVEDCGEGFAPAIFSVFSEGFAPAMESGGAA